ncbi:DUF1653 domain-containing protein [Pontibacter anaerobius]|uniref:DUF1653 domain-containing protein n=1 Tax=Pontibacter anaerobius TaxID=2993940 RepID=A0ABT3RKT7_9BACT|nr:DUF1653 domain-containing protein [Pontibacter anaerobius]MCX2741999.1 DUF1653 domain-containing protein [Pontibacter anaerobius]
MKLGIYKHFKGDYYKIISFALHSETEEVFAVYHKLDNPDKLWIRPLSMFNNVLEHNNEKIERFKFITNEQNKNIG